jgi:hypothetical protein
MNAQKAKAADRVEANSFNPKIDFNIEAVEKFGIVFIHSNDFLSIPSNGLPNSSKRIGFIFLWIEFFIQWNGLKSHLFG